MLSSVYRTSQNQFGFYSRILVSRVQTPLSGKLNHLTRLQPVQRVTRSLSQISNFNSHSIIPKRLFTRQEQQQQQKASGSTPQMNTMLLFGSFAMFGLSMIIMSTKNDDKVEITFQEFKSTFVANNLVEKLVVINNERVFIRLKDSASLGQFNSLGSHTGRMKSLHPEYYFGISSVSSFERQIEELAHVFEQNEIPVEYKRDYTRDIFVWTIPVVSIGIWIYVALRMSSGMGKGLLNIGKSKAELVKKEDKVTVTFNDVAGLDEAKQEIMEFVEFLKNPSKFTRLGARLPKGALLVGPPGTGKTLLAKATAGEASVPFFQTTGSDFIEMFVGVGPSRVRDLFAQARASAPSIIFIDEIDAIGKSRSKGGFQGSNDERENTLNQLLVEMDGFKSSEGIVVFAGTNRPDVLDSALLRPGRFDRQIAIDNPDKLSREQIFRVHLAKLKLALPIDVYPPVLAKLTPGFSGADIANVCNEAAIHAARLNRAAVEVADFESAIERVIGGIEKKSKVLPAQEKKTVAYHEAGHAVVGWFLEHGNPLLKVSIVPRGSAALGYAQYVPPDQYLYTTDQLFDQMCVMLGGRVSESIFFGRLSTGARDDLDKITQLAYEMITKYGMNSKIGPFSFKAPEGGMPSSKPYSQQTSVEIDNEARQIIQKAYERTENLLKEKKQKVEELALTLLEKEVLSHDQVELVLGARPFETKNSNI